MRTWQPSSTDEVYSLPHRRRVGGWIVAVVLLLAVGVVGWVVAKPYLGLAPRRRRSSTLAHRVSLPKARRRWPRATSISRRRTSTRRAPWPSATRGSCSTKRASPRRRRTCPGSNCACCSPDAADEQRSTKAQLADRVARVRKAADDAAGGRPGRPGGHPREGRCAASRRRKGSGAQLCGKNHRDKPRSPRPRTCWRRWTWPSRSRSGRR